MSKKFKKIVSVTTSVATIAWISGIGMLAPLAASAATINEGDTIRVADTFDVYIAKYVGSKQFKRLILNPDVFNSYGHLSWGAVKTVTQAEMDAFTTSDLVREINDYKVYKLTPNGDVGTKQWLNMTAEQFVSQGYDWDSIYIINSTDRDNYTTGSDITVGGAVGALTAALASDTPAAGVAPANASRVGATKVNFTNTSATSVTIDSLTVERTGLASDLTISSLMLYDTSDGSQIDLNQTLDANHKATFTEDIVVPAGATKSIMIAANMPSTTSTYAGQLFYLALTAVSTTATLSATLPIQGNYQTVNGTLSIGSATVNRGSLDPGTTATKEVGTTEYNFTGLKITAGSVENMSVESIRFNQAGSAASSDLANIKVAVDGTDYSTTVSSDGKYWKASFGTGVLIGKGLSKEFTVKGDIIGGSARTVEFKVYRDTDMVVKGTTYGYYRTVDGTSEQTTPTDGQFGSGTPFYEAYAVTIGTGSLRVDKNATAAPATNITEGGTGVLIGAFDVVVQGETVKAASIVVDFDHTGVGSTSDITSVTITKSDGTVLAGPVNGADATTPTAHASTLDGTADGTATFSGTVEFPVGTTQILVKGNLNTDFAANDTLRVGFNTPATKFTNMTGSVTGNSITATPASAVWANTMTVKAGSLTVTVSGTPVAQNVVAGVTGFTFTNFVFDASASGEDIRITSMEIEEVVSATGVGDEISSLQLWDGTTALNTGTNVQNPAEPTATTRTLTFTLNNALVITKATQKTIALKGNISGTATNGSTHTFGLSSTDAENDMTATGVSTANDISESITAATGQLMTIITGGQYSVALDSSNPATKLIAADTTGNIMTILKVKATGEAINISKMRLSLSNASSTGIDLANVYVYDGSTLLASGTFGNYAGQLNAASSTFTLSPVLNIGANQEKLITIKADIAAITTTDTVAKAGHRIAIEFYGSTDTSENLGTGASSGTSIANYSSTTGSNAHYIFRSVPTVASVALPSSTLVNGTQVISKFKVTADAKGDIDLLKFSIKIATTSQTTGAHLRVSDLTLYDVTDGTDVTLHATTSGTQWFADAGGVAEFVLLASGGVWGTNATTSRTVAKSTSRTFELRGTVTNSGAGASVTTQLEGDAAAVVAAPASSNPAMWKYSVVEADASDDFIWSDWSDADHTTTCQNASSVICDDFTNGYLVSGLPSSNLASQILSK